jgi:antitoxin StbD
MEHPMTDIGTTRICTMTELREPQKVLDRAGGKPVAILKNSQLVGYLVPAEAVGLDAHRALTTDAVDAYLVASQERVQPVLDYLRDK